MVDGTDNCGDHLHGKLEPIPQSFGLSRMVTANEYDDIPR